MSGKSSPLPFARVFVARAAPRAIVVTMHQNEAGIEYEDELATRLDGGFTAEELGAAVRMAMKASQRRPRDLRNAKRTEWPAFHASGERSVRRFEQEYVALDVRATNEADILASVAGVPEANADLHVTSIGNSVVPAELGARVLRVFEACRDRRV